MSTLRTLALGLALALASCQSPLTQLVIVVDTDLGAPGEIDAIELEVVQPDGMSETLPTVLTGSATELPITLGLVHRGGPLGAIAITARGRRGTTIVLTRAIRTEFVAGQTRLVRLDLTADCEAVSCPDQTCASGVCTSVDVPGAALPAFDGTTPPLDASDAMDAGPAVDAGDGGAGVDADSRVDASRDGGPSDVGVDACAAIELCNSVDDDCDTIVDEGACACDPVCMLDHATAVCSVGGLCAVRSCETGFGDCDTMASTGCERSLTTLADCGSCGRGCSSPDGVTDCSAGRCVVSSCSSGSRGDCNMDASDGCESALNTEAHCGSCDIACTGTLRCRGGTCR